MLKYGRFVTFGVVYLLSFLFIVPKRKAIGITCTVTREEFTKFLDRFAIPSSYDPILLDSSHFALDASAGYLALHLLLFSVGNFRLPLNRFPGYFRLFQCHISLLNPFGVVRLSSFVVACKAYGAGSESHPPMLNKENYVPWSSRILWYAKSRPNGKLIHNSILNGPYVRKMIPEPGDANHEITVTKTFHLQTDDELSDKELKHIEADDQVIQTILLGLPEDMTSMLLLIVVKLLRKSGYNQRISSNPRNRQIAQPGNLAGYNSVIGNQVIQNAVQNPRVQNVENQNGLIGVQGNGNQNLIGNADPDEIKEVNANCILMANLQQASTSSTQTDSAPVYDSDESAKLFKKVSDQKDNTHDTSANTKFAKQPIMENIPKVGETNALSKPVTSNSVSTPQESKGVNNDKVIAPGMFRINPFKTSRDEKHVPKIVRSSDKKKPITVSQPPVITKKDVNSDINGLSSIGVDNTKTRRPQPRNNTKHDRVTSASKSSQSKNKKLNGKKQKAKVSVKEIQMKYQPKVTKPKKVGTRESLATPKPRKFRLLLRWSPTGRLFNQEGKIVDSNECESKSDCSNGDNACTSNILEPKIKRFPNSTSLLDRNDHVAAILGFGDLQWGNILITRVYCVEGLSHNLFSVGQFCDSDLEVAFRRNACFVRNLEGVDLLKGDRSTNLYTINLHEMAFASPICLMA
nr:integrase, catalytic region, zinc finger, CCHC-type, peptidase aspartic, catalytic [Tanacetum cinerariifolium]